MPVQYLGVTGVADALGVSRHAVHKWRSRYPGESGHPFPDPDVEIDGSPGWLADRLPEVVHWRETLPGRGAGGGRPSVSHQDYLAVAAARGIDEDEAMRTIAVLVEERPELSEPESRAWLAEQWRD